VTSRAAIAFAVIALAAPARADDLQRAKQLYDEGLRHFDASEYTAAITAWTDSYALSKAPLLLFNLGQAYRLSGDCTRAMKYYDDYVHALPAPPNRGELDQAIALCKDKIAPPPQPPPPRPPDHLPPPPPPPIATITAPARSEHHTRRKRTYAYVAGGVGGVFGIVAIACAIDGQHIAKQNEGVTAWTAADAANQSRGLRDNALAYTFGALGVAAIGAGVVLYVLGSNEHGVAVAPTRGGAAASWTVRF